MNGHSTGDWPAKASIPSLPPLASIEHPHLGLGASDDVIGRHRLGQEDSTIDRGALPNMGISSQNRCPRVDGHIVIERRMTLDPTAKATGLINRKTLGTQRDALIDLAIGPDVGRLSDDDSRAVVDEERLSDGGSGMDVDTRSGMGMLVEHPGNQRNPEFVKRMRDAMDRDRIDARIADHRFIGMRCGGIAVVGRLDIEAEHAAYLWQSIDEFMDDSINLIIHLLWGSPDFPTMARGIGISNRPSHLGSQIARHFKQKSRHMRPELVLGQFSRTMESREEDLLETLEYPQHDSLVWKEWHEEMTQSLIVHDGIRELATDSIKMSPQLDRIRLSVVSVAAGHS